MSNLKSVLVLTLQNACNSLDVLRDFFFFPLSVLLVVCQREVGWSHAHTAVLGTALKYDSKESGTEKLSSV